MENNRPETFPAYFALQMNKLIAWIKPDPADNLALTVLKLVLKSVVVLLMLLVSPVLILGLTLAFFATF